MFKFKDLKNDYENFSVPFVFIMVSGKDIDKDKKGFAVSNIRVETTSGFESNIAEFTIYNCYDRLKHQYLFNDVKKYITIGSPVSIAMGYGTQAREVFRGFISQVNFVFRTMEVPGIEVHCMDLKGIMMANCYAKQIKAGCYSEAVTKILEQGFYQKLKGQDNVFDDISVADTPDKQQGNKGTTDQTIEMVCESDYEFIVKAAKKFNYEFFQAGGKVLFRKAKSDTQTNIVLSPETGLLAFEIGYDVTGIVGKVEVRNTDPGKGKNVTATQKSKGKLSKGNKAKQLISNQTRVYIDPSAASKKDADYRAQYLMEDMSYRFGTLELDMIGLPEIVPGKFIEMDGLGTAASNKFYVQSVVHEMMANSFYRTHVSGRAATL